MQEVSCTKCHAPIPPGAYNTPDLVPCPSCHVPIKIEVYPAFFRGLRVGRPGETLTDDQASCFYHPQKKAVVPCDHCGRFLCALCDVEMGDKHLCPTCLGTGKKKGKIINLERHRVLYDSVALGFVLISGFLFWAAPITASIAIYLSIRHWNSPMSMIRRTKIRFILAVVLSSLQILGWAAFIFFSVSRPPQWPG